MTNPINLSWLCLIAVIALMIPVIYYGMRSRLKYAKQLLSTGSKDTSSMYIKSKRSIFSILIGVLFCSFLYLVIQPPGWGPIIGVFVAASLANVSSPKEGAIIGAIVLAAIGGVAAIRGSFQTHIVDELGILGTVLVSFISAIFVAIIGAVYGLIIGKLFQFIKKKILLF